MRVTVTRDENLWSVAVDGLPAGLIGATDVERFEDLDIEVRDLIAGLTDTEANQQLYVQDAAFRSERVIREDE